MKKIPIILTLVCTTLTWNHKTQAAEKSSDSSSNPFISSDKSATPLARLTPERGDRTPPPIVVVSPLEKVASESWDSYRDDQLRRSGSPTPSPSKAGVSPAKGALPDDEDPEVQKLLFESITSSPPKPSFLDDEAEQRYQRDLKKAVELSSPKKSSPLGSPPLSRTASLSSGPKEEQASNRSTGSSASIESSLSSKQPTVLEEEDDGLKDALRQIEELEKKEKAEKERKLAEERRLAEEVRLKHEQEKAAISDQLKKIREKRTTLQLQLDELTEQESALSTVYIDLLTKSPSPYTSTKLEAKDKKEAASSSSTGISSPVVSSPGKGSSVQTTSDGSPYSTPLPSSAIPRSNTSSDSHSSDFSATDKERK